MVFKRQPTLRVIYSRNIHVYINERHQVGFSQAALLKEISLHGKLNSIYISYINNNQIVASISFLSWQTDHRVRRFTALTRFESITTLFCFVCVSVCCNSLKIIRFNCARSDCFGGYFHTLATVFTSNDVFTSQSKERTPEHLPSARSMKVKRLPQSTAVSLIVKSPLSVALYFRKCFFQVSAPFRSTELD